MADDQKLLSDVKYKQFVAAVDKSLKNFEYSSEWADLISCLGRLNKIIQTYSKYSAVPRKLLIGKRLAQCLHPALPSGVHLKALESYDLIFTQIGSGRLAQDLFIYTTGLFPLLSQASMSVKPVLLDLYESHLLPLKKKLYPGLSGFLLALLPGIEEVSEYTERTTDILLKLCVNTDESIFFSCLWDCVLHSLQVRLPAMTFVLTYINKKKTFTSSSDILGSDISLMVNALCGALDDTNVLVQRITLDFAISFVPFHNATLSKQYRIKLLTYALGVFLRRDMSLNRRIFQWLLNVNSEGNMINGGGLSNDDQTDDDGSSIEIYFDSYAKEILVAAVVILFKNVIINHVDYVENKATNIRKISTHLKPFRILITLLDRPEVGSAILENVMLAVLRMLYQHNLIKEKYQKNKQKHHKVVQVMHEELIKNANLLFNSFESFFLWDYFGQMFKKCTVPETGNERKSTSDTSAESIYKEKPTYCELFLLTSYVLDVVYLETSLETQAEHWPTLLNLIIKELVSDIEYLSVETILNGVSLLSKLLSKLSPNFQSMTNDIPANILSSSVLQTTKSPPTSPMANKIEFFSQDTLNPNYNNGIVVECISLSKTLFVKFVSKKVLRTSNYLILKSGKISPSSYNFATIDQSKGGKTVNVDDVDESIVAHTFQIFCRYLVELSCFPVNLTQHQQVENDNCCYVLEEWLQLLLCCCCNERLFDVQAASLSCLLDLINVVLTVQQSSSSSNTSLASIVPLLLTDNLSWIEKSNFYEVIAESLWQRITPSTCQYHQTAVDLFLRLNNITPFGSVCEIVISKSLVSQSMKTQEKAHWRFGVLWHLSREFYRDDNNKANKGVRTLDKCLLLMLDSLQSQHTKIKEYAEEWLRHCVNFGDIGRVIEPLLLILLNPTSARVAVHYAWKFNKTTNLNNLLTSDKTKTKENDEEDSGSKSELGEAVTSSSGGELSGFADDEEDDIMSYGELKNLCQVKTQNGKTLKNDKSLPTHPLLVHKLYYTQRYNNLQCLYSLKRLLLILSSEGRLFICSAATNSMSVCNTPHQSLLRELLIRHRKVLSGNEFYGTLVDAHQLLIRASTAKYLEILLSVCLYFIRSEYLQNINVTENELEENFAVQTASALVLVKITDLLLEIAEESGKGFSSYINDLLFRSKIQRIALHCLLSTVYAVTSDYKEKNETGFYSMVDCTNIVENNPHQILHKNQLCLRKSILKFIQSLIFLEHCIGTENVASTHVTDKTKNNKERHNIKNVGPFEYVAYKPVVSQPMFISATLTVLREKQWIYLHNDWTSLVVSCLRKYNEDMKVLIVPVVEQLCENIKFVTVIFKQSYSETHNANEIELPPDYMLVMLSSVTSFCQYCLINTSLSMSMSMMAPRLKHKDEASSSVFSNIVNVFSNAPPTQEKSVINETASSALSDTRDGLLQSLPLVLAAVLSVWNVWDHNKIASYSKNMPSLASHMPLPIGDPKAVRISILQLITPIAMNHTTVMMSSIADVWCTFRGTSLTKPLSNDGHGKEWITSSNKKFLPDVTEKQDVLLEIIQAIKALSLQSIIDTSKQVIRQLITSKERQHAMSLDICLLQFLHELLIRHTSDAIVQTKASLLALLKDCLQLNVTPPSLFVLFAIFNIFIHRVPVPEERRARKELQEVAQKFLESFNTIAAASLESSAWFRRSLQVVTQLDQSSDLEESTHSDKSSAIDSITPTTISNGAKNSLYSISTVLIMAEYLAPMLDMLYLSEEKDKIASALVYLMYNIVPYLKNHGHQNLAGYRACSALLSAISDYQYTLRSWKKDGYELFLDSEFFNMDKLSFSLWRSIIDRLITYDPTIFKDLMQKIALSQSGAINIFANREQEMEQRALLLKRLSLIIFCGEFDQYHQFLPDIQERLAESIRQLQGPFLHEQVFLCFRVLITRMSSHHLVSLWPPILTELVLVFVHMEHELSSVKSKNKSKFGTLDSFLGINGNVKDSTKWLRLYLAVCKLIDFLLILPSDVLPHYQVYKWAFSETPGMYCVTNLDEIENSVCSSEPLTNNKERDLKEHKDRIRHEGKKEEELSKMAVLNAPINRQKKQALKDKHKNRQKQSPKQDNLKSFFLPYISRIVKLLYKQNPSPDIWRSSIRTPGKLILHQTKITSINDLIPFFLAVTGDLAAEDVDVTKFVRFKQKHVEDLIEDDFLDFALS